MMKRQILVLSGLLAFCFSLIFLNTAQALQYEIKKGDTLYSIAQKHGVTIRDLQQANGLTGKNIQAKQIIAIPETTSAKVKPAQRAKNKPLSYYTVKKGDTLSAISQKTGVPVKQLMAANNIHPRNLRIGQKLALSKVQRRETTEEAVNEDLLPDDDEINPAETVETAELKEEISQNAELLGKWGSPDERKLFVRVATGFLGAPYRLGGSTVRGIDCSAFVRKMYQFFDIDLPRTAYEQSHVGLTIDRKELVEGDLVFFRTRRPVGHVGIYIGNNEFVHASSRDRVVRIDRIDTPYFTKRFVRAVRVKSLDESGI